MVMALSIAIAIWPSPTYSDYEPVNTATTTTEYKTETTVEQEIIPADTAGTTIESAVVSRHPRLVAQPGESQEVIDAVLKTFPDAPIMVEVARCESRLDPAADRKGIDGGLLQINQVHLPTLASMGLDRYDLTDNLTYGRILYDQSGLGPWLWSKHCWGSYLA